jgi:hypothetical protein
MSCTEFNLDDLLAIVAIPVTDYSPSAQGWLLRPTIPNTSFSPSLTNAVSIGLQPAATGGKLIPMIRKSGKAKDSESDSVAGRKHSVTVSCEADDRDSETWNYIYNLERTPSHLILTFRNGTRAFVMASEDTYLCEVSRENADTSLEFKIENLMGIQLITT